MLGDRKWGDQFSTGLSGQVDVVLTNPPLGETSHVVARENWLALAKSGDDTDPNILLDRLGVIPMRVVEERQLHRAERTLAEVEEEIDGLESRLPDGEALKPGFSRVRARRGSSLKESRN